MFSSSQISLKERLLWGLLIAVYWLWDQKFVILLSGAVGAGIMYLVK